MRGRVVSPFTLSDASAAVQDQTNVHVVTDRQKTKSWGHSGIIEMEGQDTTSQFSVYVTMLCRGM